LRGIKGFPEKVGVTTIRRWLNSAVHVMKLSFGFCFGPPPYAQFPMPEEFTGLRQRGATQFP
jgi:hypothetical protein